MSSLEENSHITSNIPYQNEANRTDLIGQGTSTYHDTQTKVKMLLDKCHITHQTFT